MVGVDGQRGETRGRGSGRESPQSARAGGYPEGRGPRVVSRSVRPNSRAAPRSRLPRYRSERLPGAATPRRRSLLAKPRFRLRPQRARSGSQEPLPSKPAWAGGTAVPPLLLAPGEQRAAPRSGCCARRRAGCHSRPAPDGDPPPPPQFGCRARPSWKGGRGLTTRTAGEGVRKAPTASGHPSDAHPEAARDCRDRPRLTGISGIEAS